MWELALIVSSKLFTEITVNSLRVHHPNGGRWGLSFATTVLTVLVFGLALFGFSLAFHWLLEHQGRSTSMLGSVVDNHNFWISLPALILASSYNFFKSTNLANCPKQLSFGAILLIGIYLALHVAIKGWYPAEGLIPIVVAILSACLVYFLLRVLFPRFYSQRVAILSLIKLPIWYQVSLVGMIIAFIFARYFFVRGDNILLEVGAAAISFGLLKLVLLVVTLVLMKGLSGHSLGDAKLLSLIIICQWWVVSVLTNALIFYSLFNYEMVFTVSAVY